MRTIPKQRFIIYYDDNTNKNHCAIVEVDSPEATTGKIVEWAGGKKDEVGEVVDMTQVRHRVGYLSHSHIEFINAVLSEYGITTSYLDFINPYMKERSTLLEKAWFIWTAFGYYLTLEVLMDWKEPELNNAFVEEIARRCSQKYVLTNRGGSIYLHIGDKESLRKMNPSADPNGMQELTSLEALKQTGLVCMELAGEKTVAYVRDQPTIKIKTARQEMCTRDDCMHPDCGCDSIIKSSGR